MTIYSWASRHGISATALAELSAALLPTDASPLRASARESTVLAQVRRDTSRAGWRLWRNNVGAAYTAEGGFVRYGLANESAQMNAVIKSSDLIGIRPVTVTAELVGQTIGQFAAVECKAPNWRRRPNDPREAAQERFLLLVQSLGGYGVFSTGGAL